MRFRDLASTCALALAVTFAAPALARGHQNEQLGERDMRPEWKGDRDPEFGRMREDWLSQCRGRVAERGGPGQSLAGASIGGPDACETALQNYYAAGGGYGPGTIMVPVTIPAPPCVETLTTEVRPARRVIPRPAPRPDKRIRIAPDKRIRIQ